MARRTRRSPTSKETQRKAAWLIATHRPDLAAAGPTQVRRELQELLGEPLTLAMANRIKGRALAHIKRKGSQKEPGTVLERLEALEQKMAAIESTLGAVSTNGASKRQAAYQHEDQ